MKLKQVFEALVCANIPFELHYEIDGLNTGWTFRVSNDLSPRFAATPEDAVFDVFFNFYLHRLVSHG